MKIVTLRLGAYGVNTYILYRDDLSSCAVIDPGDGYEKLKDTLQDLALTPTAIILTHAHFDHIASINKLRRDYPCPIYVHCDEAEMLADSEKNMTRFFLDEEIEIKDPETLLSDGDVFEAAGLEFCVMHTPGHSKGSVIYKCDNVLITGDTLFSNTCGRCDLWSSSVSDMKNSLDKIFSEQRDLTFYSGHGGVATLNRVRPLYKYFI